MKTHYKFHKKRKTACGLSTTGRHVLDVGDKVDDTCCLNCARAIRKWSHDYVTAYFKAFDKTLSDIKKDISSKVDKKSFDF